MASTRGQIKGCVAVTMWCTIFSLQSKRYIGVQLYFAAIKWEGVSKCEKNYLFVFFEVLHLPAARLHMWFTRGVFCCLWPDTVCGVCFWIAQPICYSSYSKKFIAGFIFVGNVKIVLRSPKRMACQ